MSARLMANPQFRPTLAGQGRDEMPRPPRAMAASARKGNRRRAMPRWAKPAFKAALIGVPTLVLLVSALTAWKRPSLAETLAAAQEGLLESTSSLGFVLDEVLVVGRNETERSTVMDSLGIVRGDSILAFDLAEAKARLEELPWVSSASIERRLPGTLYIRLTERQPMAIWQHDRQFTVIDRAGRPLADAVELARRGNQRIETLPQVIGTNAPQQVQALLEALDKVPSIRPRVTSANWISDRRWNLQLDNGVTVKLPEGTGMPMALRQLAEMNSKGKVLDRDIVAIDLRQPDRAILQTSATAQLPGMEDEAAKKKPPGKKT
ncbi:cell division protein FtsQ/DivIB [Azospirillum griseum]|uniref:Cell division protein FtsQ n=1 Tax=Azospirillum griseum TaxID=2496639 RepID=A0A431VHC7_9PROT|nr:cell division protein FtsQ/DivIB [Azospirillum griseum]RTR19174.1 FtsQ-type POTRA domain-containing protein [Azospirillum griseum]